MTKQEIVELIKDNLQYECYNGFGISEYSINTAEIYDKADTLLAEFEQEKKEQAREIICWFANETEKAFGKNYLAERIAKEYGVEL